MQINQEPTLDRVVAKLAVTPNLESSLRKPAAWVNPLMDLAERTTDLAFNAGSRTHLLAAHRTLRVLYDQHILPNTPAAPNQYNPYLIDARRTIEDGWMEAEAKRSNVDMNQVPTGKQEFAQHFQDWVLTHPAANHKVYDYMATQATRADMQTFFRDEQPLDVRFWDIIALAAVGTDGSVRAEVTTNMWDEAGLGKEKYMHTNLYREIVRKLGMNETDEQFAQDMDVEALAGYNLFQYFGQNRALYNESVGALGTTELLDPPLYTKFMVGANRLGLDKELNLGYYSEHISIDVFHGEGWIQRVMLPTMDQAPDATAKFMRGAEMRLHTAGDYYDALHTKLTQGK